MNLTLDLTLDDFRSLMLLLETQHGGTQWTLPSGARLVIQRAPDADPALHASWVVSIPIDVDGSNRRHATIQAFKRAAGCVVLVEDRQRITSSGQCQLLDPDRAIGPLLHELCHELQRQIDLWAPPPTKVDVGRPRVGRPRDADYDWAYQEIKNGRDQPQVYREWLERIPRSQREQLVDPLDSFKKAMSYRAEQEKREKRE
jgi:hypothetical protein